MKKLIIVAAFAFIGGAVNAQSNWKIDNSHSNVRFNVSHLVISEVEGNFKKFNGSINNAPADFNGAKVNFTVDVNSINTDNEGRDKHLKADDFFNAEQYPNMIFEGTNFKKLSGNKYALYGNLTIRNVTKPVKFEVTYGGTVKDPYGNIKAGFKATSKINRFDYGLKWNTLTEAGGAAVGKEISIALNLEFAKV
jgi:polyisoprenoid-binding protein YceI